MEIKYILELDGVNIGYTEFEYADPPMGVVHGKIIFDGIDSPYNLFRNHCEKYKIQINSDFPKEKFIDTVVIPELKILLQNGSQLPGWGAAITGMDSDEFEIQFGGIASELMQTESKHHFLKYYGHE